KPRSIDDVPILALTLSSSVYDHFTLRRIAAQLHDQVKEIPNVSEVRIIGGQHRQVRRPLWFRVSISRIRKSGQAAFLRTTRSNWSRQVDFLEARKISAKRWWGFSTIVPYI